MFRQQARLTVDQDRELAGTDPTLCGDYDTAKAVDQRTHYMKTREISISRHTLELRT